MHIITRVSRIFTFSALIGLSLISCAPGPNDSFLSAHSPEQSGVASPGANMSLED